MSQRRASFMEIVRKLGPAGPMLLAASTLPPIGMVVLLWFMNPLSQWLREHGTYGPVIFAGGFVVLGGLALMPTYVYSALGGWAFGFAVGFPAAMCGYVGGAVVAYYIARITCGDRVVHLLDEHPRWRAVYDELLCANRWRTLVIVSLVRLASSPYAATNLVFAAAKVPMPVYIAGTIIGLSIRTSMVVYFAAKVGGEKFVYAEQKWMLWAGIIAAVGVIVILTQIAQRAVDRVTRRQAAPSVEVP